MRRKDDSRFLSRNLRFDFFNRTRCPGRFGICALLTRFQDNGLTGDTAHVKNLCPPVTEPAISNDHDFLAMGKLTRHGFHAKSAAAWHQDHGVRRIDVFQDARDVLHHALKALGHVVQSSVCVNHRKFEQAIGVNVGQ